MISVFQPCVFLGAPPGRSFGHGVKRGVVGRRAAVENPQPRNATRLGPWHAAQEIGAVRRGVAGELERRVERDDPHRGGFQPVRQRGGRPISGGQHRRQIQRTG